MRSTRKGASSAMVSTCGPRRRTGMAATSGFGSRLGGDTTPCSAPTATRTPAGRRTPPPPVPRNASGNVTGRAPARGTATGAPPMAASASPTGFFRPRRPRAGFVTVQPTNREAPKRSSSDARPATPRSGIRKSVAFTRGLRGGEASGSASRATRRTPRNPVRRRRHAAAPAAAIGRCPRA